MSCEACGSPKLTGREIPQKIFSCQISFEATAAYALPINQGRTSFDTLDRFRMPKSVLGVINLVASARTCSHIAGVSRLSKRGSIFQRDAVFVIDTAPFSQQA